MVDHITIRVQNIEVTKAFYARVLAKIGYDVAQTIDETHDGVRVIGFVQDGKPDIWFTTDTPIS